MYGPPATVSPGVRLYVALTPSAARNPPRVPPRTGSASPYVLVAASGVTEAASGVIVKAALAPGANV